VVASAGGDRGSNASRGAVSPNACGRDRYFRLRTSARRDDSLGAETMRRVSVNMSTPALFAEYPTPRDLAAAGPGEGRRAHRSTASSAPRPAACSEWRRRDEHTLRRRDQARISTNWMTLPGVGRKTAMSCGSGGIRLQGWTVDTQVGGWRAGVHQERGTSGRRSRCATSTAGAPESGAG